MDLEARDLLCTLIRMSMLRQEDGELLLSSWRQSGENLPQQALTEVELREEWRRERESRVLDGLDRIEEFPCISVSSAKSSKPSQAERRFLRQLRELASSMAQWHAFKGMGATKSAIRNRVTNIQTAFSNLLAQSKRSSGALPGDDSLEPGPGSVTDLAWPQELVDECQRMRRKRAAMCIQRRWRLFLRRRAERERSSRLTQLRRDNLARRIQMAAKAWLASRREKKAVLSGRVKDRCAKGIQRRWREFQAQKRSRRPEGKGGGFHDDGEAHRASTVIARYWKRHRARECVESLRREREAGRDSACAARFRRVTLALEGRSYVVMRTVERRWAKAMFLATGQLDAQLLQAERIARMEERTAAARMEEEERRLRRAETEEERRALASELPKGVVPVSNGSDGLVFVRVRDGQALPEHPALESARRRIASLRSDAEQRAQRAEEKAYSARIWAQERKLHLLNHAFEILGG